MAKTNKSSSSSVKLYNYFTGEYMTKAEYLKQSRSKMKVTKDEINRYERLLEKGFKEKNIKLPGVVRPLLLTLGLGALTYLTPFLTDFLFPGSESAARVAAGIFLMGGGDNIFWRNSDFRKCF